jgi:hypothetical protein
MSKYTHKKFIYINELIFLLIYFLFDIKIIKIFKNVQNYVFNVGIIFFVKNVLIKIWNIRKINVNVRNIIYMMKNYRNV